MRTQFLLAASYCFLCTVSSAQLNNPQIRMRLGAGRSLLSTGTSDNDAVYRIYDPGSLAASWIGFEFSKQFRKNKNMNLLFGIFFDEQSYAVGINPKRFSQQPSSSNLKSSQSPIRVYSGLEKRIGKKELGKGSGYFSIFGGLGISYNGSTESSGWSGKEIGEGTTTDGKHFKGEYINNPLLTFTGYFMGVYERAAHPITPDLFAGVRWNLLNQKNNMAIGAELLINYSVMTKFYLEMPYTLDNQSELDRLKNRGTNVQLNLIIPIKNFRKKKEE